MIRTYLKKRYHQNRNMIDYKIYSLSDILENFSDNEKEKSLNKYFMKFSCPLEKELEIFLVKHAIEYERIEYGKTFLFLNSKEFTKGIIDIIAFFTIGQKSLDISELSSKKKKKVIGNSIPGRENLTSIPGFLIGEIGRSGKYSHDDLPGSIILQESYKQIKRARKVVGGNLIFLECRKKMFDLFYKKQNFKKISNDSSCGEDDLIMLYKKIG